MSTTEIPETRLEKVSLVMLEHNDSFLVLLRPNNRWAPPGGHLLLTDQTVDGKEESSIDAAARELQEETGIAVSRNSLVHIADFDEGKYNVHLFYTKYQDKDLEDRYPRSRERYPNVKLSGEHKGHVFLHKKTLKELMTATRKEGFDTLLRTGERYQGVYALDAYAFTNVTKRIISEFLPRILEVSENAQNNYKIKVQSHR